MGEDATHKVSTLNISQKMDNIQHNSSVMWQQLLQYIRETNSVHYAPVWSTSVIFR